MPKFNSLLIGRFKTEKKEKMNELVKRSAAGDLSSFSGVFQISPMSEAETTLLKALLETYKTDETDTTGDLSKLQTITSEIKAITNQAVVLHGQRIKLAQEILKKYRDGAFSAYLIKVYGNRQTPYNFLQYFELYSTLSQKLKEIVDEMPRQAIYSLSSRSISKQEKEAFIETYRGESKNELMQRLRDSFPLSEKDKRRENRAKTAKELLKKALKSVQSTHFNPTAQQRQEIQKLLDQIRTAF